MPILTISNPTLEKLLVSNALRDPVVRREYRSLPLRISPLFEVRSLSMSEVAEGTGRLPFESAITDGWWAFVIQGEDILGVAELTLTRTAIAYAGVNTGELGARATKALRRAEGLAKEREMSVWFFRIDPLFFIGLIIEDGTAVRLLPLEGARARKDLRNFARRRIDAAQERDRQYPSRDIQQGGG